MVSFEGKVLQLGPTVADKRRKEEFEARKGLLVDLNHIGSMWQRTRHMEVLEQEESVPKALVAGWCYTCLIPLHMLCI